MTIMNDIYRALQWVFWSTWISVMIVIGIATLLIAVREILGIL